MVSERLAVVGSESNGNGFKLIQSRTLDLSREEALKVANEHLGLTRAPTERELDDNRLEQLIDRIKDGHLVSCCWATADYQGVKYRMNGQHSSKAIIEAAEFLPEKVAIHLDHYSTSGAEGMALLFRQFDARFSGRSKQDVSGAYQGLVPELQGLERKIMKLGVEGIAWYERYIERIKVPSDDEVYSYLFVPSYHQFLTWLNGIFVNNKSPELMRAATVGAMYGTYLVSESGAQEFWVEVARGQVSNISNDSDPRLFLSNEMVAIKKNKDRKFDDMRPAHFYGKSIKAWNAFQSNEKIQSLNYNPKKGYPSISPWKNAGV